jgi:hypothetical protein
MILYKSNDEVKVGDVVRINHEREGLVIAVVLDQCSVSKRYYFNEFGPGVLFKFDGWGHVYYPAEDIPDDEDLFLIRRESKRERG